MTLALQTHNAFQMLVNHHPDGILLVDIKGCIQFVNPAAEAMLGRNAADLMDVPFGYPVADRTEIKILLRTAEMRVTEVVWEGEPIYLVSLRDISEHRQLEQQLRKTVEELETFNHTVAHELKNPLASVLGFSGLIKQQFVRQSTSDLQYYVEQIEESVHDMTGMITNLLYLAQIQDTNHAFEPIDVTLVVKKALRRFERQIEKQHITVTVAADLPAALGHETWLEEVFANFISNAIKYMGSDNPVPEIHIGGSKNDDMLRYWVQDTGIGITPEDQAAIFEKYARVEKSVEGIGLGLPIVRHIITRLGGNVGVESEPGKGSTFWFTLPTPEWT